MNRPTGDTRSALLGAAEELFAERGVAGASVRQITARAGANVAAIRYHFGSKRALVQEALRRRLEPLNRERLAALDRHLASAAGLPDPAAIARAFTAPLLELVRRERGGHAFCRWMLRTTSEPEPELRDLAAELDGDCTARFVAALSRCLPQLRREEVHWRLLFAAGAIAHAAALGYTLRHQSGGLCDPLDLDGVTDRLVAFLEAGLSAPPTPRTPGP
jgi:AcrR family transcriptional regulator